MPWNEYVVCLNHLFLNLAITLMWADTHSTVTTFSYNEWVSEWKALSRVWLFATPWTIQSMECSRPEHWSGEPFPSSGNLPNKGIKPRSPALQADSLQAEPQGKPLNCNSFKVMTSFFTYHIFTFLGEPSDVPLHCFYTLKLDRHWF